MTESNSSIGPFSEHSKNHVTKTKSIVSISILIGILFLSITSIQTPVVLADPGISYTLQAQEKDGTWTPGLVTGYDECEDVPIRLIISYTRVTESPKDETNQTVSLEGAYKDSDSPFNYGLDYFKDFAYNDTGGLDGTPTVDGHTLTWAAGVGTGSEINSSSIKNIKYVLFYELTAGSTGTLIITWKAHLAKGGENLIPADRGASNWIGPPTANIQVSADPPSGGVKTVNIQKPGTITTATTTVTTNTTTTNTTTTNTTTTNTTTTNTTTTNTTTTNTTTTNTTTTETTTETTETTTKITETTETIEEFDDPLAPVGGYVMPVNKLSVISPYLVILGMIAFLLTLLKMSVHRKY